MKDVIKYWIVVASDGTYALQTISYGRKAAIDKWLDGTQLNWKTDRKKYGWRVVKVKIEITEI